jgi:DNA-binding NarL/FixJ family response regulator
MRKSSGSVDSEQCPPPAVATVLVMSQHEGVRRQLVVYLGRSPSLRVSGDVFSSEAILQARPDVLVLDLSQLERGGLGKAIDAARQVGARLIALASMRDLADERAVTDAGGLYRLKSAGADGLADIVTGVAAERGSSPVPRVETGQSTVPSIAGQRADRRRARTGRDRIRSWSER